MQACAFIFSDHVIVYNIQYGTRWAPKWAPVLLNLHLALQKKSLKLCGQQKSRKQNVGIQRRRL